MMPKLISSVRAAIEWLGDSPCQMLQMLSDAKDMSKEPGENVVTCIYDRLAASTDLDGQLRALRGHKSHRTDDERKRERKVSLTGADTEKEESSSSSSSSDEERDEDIKAADVHQDAHIRTGKTKDEVDSLSTDEKGRCKRKRLTAPIGGGGGAGCAAAEPIGQAEHGGPDDIQGKADAEDEDGQASASQGEDAHLPRFKRARALDDEGEAAAGDVEEAPERTADVGLGPTASSSSSSVPPSSVNSSPCSPPSETLQKVGRPHRPRRMAPRYQLLKKLGFLLHEMDWEVVEALLKHPKLAASSEDVVYNYVDKLMHLPRFRALSEAKQQRLWWTCRFAHLGCATLVQAFRRPVAAILLLAASTQLLGMKREEAETALRKLGAPIDEIQRVLEPRYAPGGGAFNFPVSVGLEVDAWCRHQQQWYRAVILAFRESDCLIHYLGWPRVWDTWLDSTKVAMLQTYLKVDIPRRGAHGQLPGLRIPGGRVRPRRGARLLPATTPPITVPLPITAPLAPPLVLGALPPPAHVLLPGGPLPVPLDPPAALAHGAAV